MKSPIALRIFLVGTIMLFLAVVPTFFNKAFASTILFQDNFDTESNGSFPNNWEIFTYPNTCPDPWLVQDGMLKISINNYNSCTTNIVPKPNVWDNNADNYIFDVDMTFAGGTDHNLIYRTDPPNLGWELHFQTPGILNFSAPPGSYNVNIQKTYQVGETHRITVREYNKNIKVFIDAELVKDYTTNNPLPTGGIALRAGVGGDPHSETWFDNVVVSTIDETPTPTPSPTPTPINLNVPVLRQTDKPWATQVYDGANFWSPLTKAIKNWGCALTSYTMVLKYFGINKLPNGINLDPGTLNTWLKNNHGYIDGKHSGYVNPLAISSLSKKATKINNITSFDALEYTRVNSSDQSLLTEQLNNSHPVVLEEPGHYIVANGINSSTFSIIDPYYADRINLTAYGNTFNSLNELIPSNTDLSYIMVTGNENLDMQIMDSNGNNLGEQFFQQPLVNPETNEEGGDPLKIDYFQKPQSGNYRLALTSNKSGAYDVNVYSYDKDGNVMIEDFPIVSHVEKSDTIDINFDNQNSSNSKLRKEVTFESLIDDIKDLNSLHLIKSKTAKELTGWIENIKKHYNKQFKFITKMELELLHKSLFFYGRHDLTQKAYEVISEDIKSLIDNL